MREGEVTTDFDPANKRPLHRDLAIGAGIALLGYLVMMAPAILLVFAVNLGIGLGLVVLVQGMLLIALGLYLVRELEPLQAAHRISGTLEKLQRDVPRDESGPSAKVLGTPTSSG